MQIDYQNIIDHSYTLIEASAGTGKTYTIEQLFLEMVQRGVKVSKIVVITFTDKATAELKERLHSKIEQSSHDELCQQALKNWSQNRISTIHSFCRRVLRDIPFETASYAGDNYGEVEFDNLIEKFFAEKLFKQYYKEAQCLGLYDLSKLQTFQKYCSQLLNKFNEEDILHPNYDDVAIKFANSYPKFCRLYKALLEVNFKQQLNMWHADTAANFKNNFLNYLSGCGEEFSPNLLNKLFKQTPSTIKNAAWNLLNKPLKKTFSKKLIDFHLLRFLEFCQQFYNDWQEFKNACQIKIYKSILTDVRRYKQEMQSYGFDDLIIKVQKAVNKQEVLQYLQNQYSYFVIDEFQDTDARQWAIFKTVTMRGDKPAKLIVVGDPKQAIYRFRGADFAVYMQAKNDIEISGGKVYNLTTNWRSLPNLISSCNQFFRNGGFNLAPAKVSPPSKDQQKIKIYQDDSGDKTIHIFDEYSNKEHLAKAMVQRVKTLVEGKMILVDSGYGQKRFIRYTDICFLINSRADVSNYLAPAFAKYAVPYFFHKQKNIFSCRSALNLSVALRCLADKHSKSLRKLLLTSDFFGYAPNLFKSKDFSPDPIFFELLQKWQVLVSEQKWQHFFDSLFYETNFLKRRNQENFEQVFSNYKQLVEEVLIFAYDKNISEVSQWFEELRLEKKRFVEERNFFRQNIAEDKVSVMTIHNSKGLEFPIVFLYDFISFKAKPPQIASIFLEKKQTYQRSFAKDDLKLEQTYLNEERYRLYYVAMTRAVFKLYLAVKNTEDKVVADILACRQYFLPSDCEGQSIQYVVDTQNDGQNNEVEERSDIILPNYRGRWRQMSSFSSLARYFNKPAMMTFSKIDEDYGEEQRNDGFYGAKVGLALHQILEDLSFKEVLAYDNWQSFYEDKRQFIENILKSYSLNASKLCNSSYNYAQEASRFCWQALMTIIEPLGIKLAQISPKNYLNELEFLMSANLQESLAKVPHIDLPKGYVLGFVDLVFRLEDTYYLLDWKSNLLPAYDQENLQKSIKDHYYYLQYELYSIALCSWLDKFANPDIRFGGSIYIYLRGFDSGGGVYFDQYEGDDLKFDRNKYYHLNGFNKK